jgi:hypothetical protein
LVINLNLIQIKTSLIREVKGGVRMKFTINNNKFYLNDVKLDKLISYSIVADINRTKLTIELIVDDVEIETRRREDGKRRN